MSTFKLKDGREITIDFNDVKSIVSGYNKNDWKEIKHILEDWLRIANNMCYEDLRIRGYYIKETREHDAGAYGRCSNCGRYSENPSCTKSNDFICTCGKKHYYSGSFVRPDENSQWCDN